MVYPIKKLPDGNKVAPIKSSTTVIRTAHLGPSQVAHKAMATKVKLIFIIGVEIMKNLDKIIYVLTLKTDSFIRFNSWDKFILPKPFAKVEVHYSEIFYVSDEKDEASLKADTERLQNYMLMRTEEVCKEFV